MGIVCTDRPRALVRAVFVACSLLGLLSACGDNGGNSGSGRITFTVSGSSNPTSSGLQIELNSGNPLPIAANQQAWTFPTGLEEGNTYTVAVKSNPQSETCTVQNGSGKVGQTNILGVAIVCTATPYAVLATVSGFTGSGLVLEDTLSVQKYAVSGNGTFVVESRTSGTSYNIIADTSNTSPLLSCQVANGSNTVAGGPVMNIAVACSVVSFSLGGSITGLAGSNLVITETVSGQQIYNPKVGTTSFDFTIPSGSAYNVVVQSPTHTSTGLTQNCSVANGSGTVGTIDVNNIQINCSTQPYLLSGTIVLPASQSSTPAGLILTETISGNQATINSASANPNGPGYLASFSFPPLLDGSSFNISIAELESQYVNPSLHCIIDGAGATGLIAGQNSSSVVVKCRPISSFLAAAGNSLGDESVLTQEGAFDCFNINPVSGQLQEAGGTGITQGVFPFALVAGGSFNNLPVLESNFFFAYSDGQNAYLQRSNAQNTPDDEGYLCSLAQPYLAQLSVQGQQGDYRGVMAFDQSGGGTLYATIGLTFLEVSGVSDSNPGSGGNGLPNSSVQYTPISEPTFENAIAFPATSLQFDGTGNYAFVFQASPTGNAPEPGFFGPNGFTPLHYSSGSWSQITNDATAIANGGFAQAGMEGLTSASSLAIGENIYVLANDLTGCDSSTIFGNCPVSAPQIVGYSLDATTGALTLSSGSPFQDKNATTDAAASLVSYCYDPSNLELGQSCSSSAQNLIFLVNQSAGIDVFEQAQGGGLTLLTTSGPIATNVEGISSVVIDPSGKFLYAAATISSNVVAYRINPTANAASNLLTLVGAYPVIGVNPNNLGLSDLGATLVMAIDSSGKFLYVLGSQLSGFLIDPNTGALSPTPGSPYAISATFETLLAISPQ